MAKLRRSPAEDVVIIQICSCSNHASISPRAQAEISGSLHGRSGRTPMVALSMTIGILGSGRRGDLATPKAFAIANFLARSFTAEVTEARRDKSKMHESSVASVFFVPARP